MDDLIDIFITTHYTEEAQEEIYQTIGLFKAFNYMDAFGNLTQMLMMESYLEPDVMLDTFTQVLINGQDYILDRHGVELSSEATLSFRNICLTAMLLLQKQDDVVPILRILESEGNQEEKLSRILEHVTDIPATTFIQVLEEVRPICLRMLADFLYAQESNEQKAVPELVQIRENVRKFTQTYGMNAAVRTIIDSDVVMGEEFKLYIPIYNELREQVTDEQMLVETLLFLLLYSSDGVKAPVEVYSQNSGDLISDMTAVARLGKTLAYMVTHMSGTKEMTT